MVRSLRQQRTLGDSGSLLQSQCQRLLTLSRVPKFWLWYFRLPQPCARPCLQPRRRYIARIGYSHSAMLSDSFRVSVVIRTKDVENRFRGLLQRLAFQTLKPVELVVVDNFSSEEKLQEMSSLLASVKKRLFGGAVVVKLVPVTREEFSHAYSTNAGIFASTSPFVCMTNGHSLPLSDKWLESGVSHLRDARVAGVGGYSTPHKDGTFWEKLFYGWTWRRLNETSGRYLADRYFSTTNCVLRRSLWEDYPFDENLPEAISYDSRFGGEDYDWSREMLARGYEIVVDPKFCVYHSHGEGLSVLLRKYSAWRKVRKRVGMLKRPRQSYTRLRIVNLRCKTL